MELTVQNETQQPLLKRKEIAARVFFEATTPSRYELREALAKKLKCDVNLLLIESIQPVYGDTAATILAHQYDDASTLERVEGSHMQKRYEKAPAAEEPAEAPAEAAPTEEAPAEESAEAPAEEAPAEAAEEPAEEKKEESE